MPITLRLIALDAVRNPWPLSACLFSLFGAKCHRFQPADRIERERMRVVQILIRVQ